MLKLFPCKFVIFKVLRNSKIRVIGNSRHSKIRVLHLVRQQDFTQIPHNPNCKSCRIGVTLIFTVAGRFNLNYSVRNWHSHLGFELTWFVKKAYERYLITAICTLMNIGICVHLSTENIKLFKIVLIHYLIFFSFLFGLHSNFNISDSGWSVYLS